MPLLLLFCLRNQLCPRTSWARCTRMLLCCLTGQRFWQLSYGPFFFLILKPTERQTSSLSSSPFLPTKYFSLITVSWPAVVLREAHTCTQITEPQSFCPEPASKASWLSQLTQSRRNSPRLPCSRSGCHGWAAAWTAGEDVSAVNKPFWLHVKHDVVRSCCCLCCHHFNSFLFQMKLWCLLSVVSVFHTSESFRTGLCSVQGGDAGKGLRDKEGVQSWDESRAGPSHVWVGSVVSVWRGPLRIVPKQHFAFIIEQPGCPPCSCRDSHGPSGLFWWPC